MYEGGAHMAKTIVALFKDKDLAERAIEDLNSFGIKSKDISIVLRDARAAKDLSHDTGASVAGGAMSGATTGGVLGALAGLLIANGVFPGLGTLLIGGPLAATLGLTGTAATIVSGAATGALAGTLVGALMGFGLTETEAKTYEEELKTGAIFVAVPARDEDESDVLDILADYEATQVKVLAVPTEETVDENLHTARDIDVFDSPRQYAGMKGGVSRSKKRR